MSILSSDLLRGNIDTIVLTALTKEPRYGTEIRQAIAKKSNGMYKPNEQSLYSAFHRLEKNGQIKGSWGEDALAKRKYYTITQQGRERLVQLKEEWQIAKLLLELLMREE